MRLKLDPVIADAADQGSPVAIPLTGGDPTSLPDDWILHPLPISVQGTERELNGLISSATPRIRSGLTSTWTDQAAAMTNAEILAAINRLALPATWAIEWAELYDELVTDRMEKEWARAYRAGAARIEAGTSGLEKKIDPATEELLQTWLEQRGRFFTDSMTTGQSNATLALILAHVAGDQMLSAPNLARIIRPTIGLTSREAGWVGSRYWAMIAEEVPVERALSIVTTFANRMTTTRASRMARTELAFAYNYGALQSMRTTQERLLPGELVVKTWTAQEDERTCPFCGELDGQIVGMEQTFPGLTPQVPNVIVPPAHPFCRCTIVYSVVEDPNAI